MLARGHPANVERIRKRCVLDGLEAALGRRKRSRERATVLNDEGEAQLVAIACSEPPAGRARWTLHMLCDELKTAPGSALDTPTRRCARC